MLEIKNLTVSYGDKIALRNFTFDMAGGELVALVGESGSGKTTAIRAILGLLPPGGEIQGGELTFFGTPLVGLGEKKWKSLRGKEIAAVFQDCGAMLNPIRTIGSQFKEYIRTHSRCSAQQALERSGQMLEKMGLSQPKRILEAYPFQISGGQRQRVGIAMAMTFSPRLLLADEPTSALDAAAQVQIARQIKTLCREHQTGVLMVTHNLPLAACMADRILVMREGEVVAQGDWEQLLAGDEGYTRQLVQTVRELGGERYV